MPITFTEGLRLAVYPWNPRILFNAKYDCTKTEETGSRRQAAGVT